MYLNQDRLRIKSIKRQADKLLSQLDKARERFHKSEKLVILVEDEIKNLREQCADARSEMNTEYLNYSRDLDNDFENARIAYFEADRILKKARQRRNTLNLEYKAHQAELAAAETEYNNCRTQIRQLEERLYYPNFRKVGD